MRFLVPEIRGTGRRSLLVSNTKAGHGCSNASFYSDGQDGAIATQGYHNEDAYIWWTLI